MRATATSWDGELPHRGDILQTEAGTTYLIEDVRPGRINPFVMDITKLGDRDANVFLDDPDVVVYSWRWNPRSKTSGRKHAQAR